MINLPILRNSKIIHVISIVILFGLIVLTFIYILLLRGQYKEVLEDIHGKEVKAERINRQYSKSSTNIVLDEYQKIDFIDLDKLMSIKKYNMHFNHLRLINHNNLLQIEGTAIQLADIGGIRNDAKNIGLSLEIKQIETDDNGLIQFELSQVRP